MGSLKSGVAAAFLATMVGGVLAVALQGLSVFVEFMPPLPWAIGCVLLVIALVIGFIRGQFIGLGFVAFWAVCLGISMMMAPVVDHGGGLDTIGVALYRIIPWAFVVCCAAAGLMNATS